MLGFDTAVLVTVLGTVLVAIIGGPLMWFLSNFKKINTAEHEANRALNVANAAALGRIESKIDSHLEWHVEAGPTLAPVIVLHPPTPQEAS